MIKEIIRAYKEIRTTQKTKESIANMSLDYDLLRKIAKEYDRRVEIKLMDGTIINFYDKMLNNAENRPEFW